MPLIMVLQLNKLCVISSKNYKRGTKVENEILEEETSETSETQDIDTETEAADAVTDKKEVIEDA